MVVGFHDQNGKRLHDQFQEWRRANSKGYFLTFKAPSRVLVHASLCHHAGPIGWDGNEPWRGATVWASLTRHRKVCSKNQAELLAWADRTEVKYRSCAHCIDAPLTKSRAVRIRYVERTTSIDNGIPMKRANAKYVVEAVLEGVLKEITTSVRSRSAVLRRAALEESEGVCAACRSDFSKVLNGRGLRVLQVHHRKQLALSETPTWNSLADLAVLCANCHLLIHSDIKNAMMVGDLRELLARSSRQ